MAIPNCPACDSAYAYEDRHLFVCPECGHEWTATEENETEEAVVEEKMVRDAHGTPLTDGDSITIIKDLKVKGSSNPLKQGTNIKNIRLIDGVDDHNIDCKITGFGSMQLKSEFVKKI